jgi:hypothetical protein
MNLFISNQKVIKKDSDVSTLAVNQAMNECPKTTDAKLDIHQQNIIDSVSNSLVSAHHSSMEKLNKLDSTRKNIEAFIEGFSFNGILEATKQKIVHHYAEWHEILNNAKKEEEAVNRNYKYFTYQNKLNREAVYPDNKVFHWAIVVAAVLFETIFNSFFFAGASDSGLLGGYFQALFISLTNVGSSLLIGIYILPDKNHVNPKKQSRAKAITSLYFFLAFLFNLAAAHYRTLLEEDPFNAGINTIPHLIQEPLGINFDALNLLIIGILFVIIAMIKGYKSDDIYPGFGEIHRQFKSASNHHGKRIEAMKEIKKIINDGISQATSLIKEAKREIGNYKDSIQQSEEVALNFSKHLQTAENVSNNELWKYREANSRVRSTKPPAYFKERYTFKKHSIEVDLTTEKVTCKQIETRLQELENSEKAKLYDGLSDLNEKALEKIAGYLDSMDNDETKTNN